MATENGLVDGAFVETTVTYLEMTAPPQRRSTMAPVGKLAILRAEHPTVSFYRYLYNTIGEAWTWTDRRQLDDEALRAIIHAPLVEIYVLYVAGVPAGYVELDRRREDNVELAYFGMVPEFMGRGLGSYFLDWGIWAAWAHEPARVWVNTCTLDHPRALPLYQRAGFVAYKQQVEMVATLDAPTPIEPTGGGSG